MPLAAELIRFPTTALCDRGCAVIATATLPHRAENQDQFHLQTYGFDPLGSLKLFEFLECSPYITGPSKLLA